MRIFLLSAIGNDIPNFHEVAEMMASVGVPAPRFMLAGAIAFLVVGSVSLVIGPMGADRCRPVAGLSGAGHVLLSRLLEPGGPGSAMQQIQFMKNPALMGAMLFVMANGSRSLELGPTGADCRARPIQAAS